MRNNRRLAVLFLFFLTTLLHAIPQPSPSLPQTQPPATATEIPALSTAPPVSTRQIFFNKGVKNGRYFLTGIVKRNQLNFNIRRDEIVSKAMFHFKFIASPSLTPLISQIKVYLNNQLQQVIPITENMLGKPTEVDIPFDPRDFNDTNTLMLFFIGHYPAVCETEVHTSLWVDIDKDTALTYTAEKVEVKNDLSYFPEPFFDELDESQLVLPMIFSGSPSPALEKSAAILASWFGLKAKWRGQSFPVLFNTLPEKNAIVFATNDNKPAFLSNHAPVNAPTIELISSPDNKYVKLLLILGRNDADLDLAVRGIASGNLLFRGSSVVVDQVQPLATRKPYDAPNWINTDRPVPFSHLQNYKEQLETAGFELPPVSIDFTIPPDIYLKHDNGVALKLKYHYSPAPATGRSLLNISMNNHFIVSYSLNPLDQEASYSLPSGTQNTTETKQFIKLPINYIEGLNKLVFGFDYVKTIGGGTIAGGDESTHVNRGVMQGSCETHTTIDNHASIDTSSTIDVTGHWHYITMPNLTVFMNSGFPFTRLADLSETVALMNSNPSEEEVSILLNVVGNMGSKTYYPVYNLQIIHDASMIKKHNDDILMIGRMPYEAFNEAKINLLIEAVKASIKTPFRQNGLDNLELVESDSKGDMKATIGSSEPIGAVVGLQSPFDSNRSVVALLANGADGFKLLNNALVTPVNYGHINGSVSVVRNSGVQSLRVGPTYDLGYIPWWIHLNYYIAEHPVFMAILVVIVALLLPMMIWNSLKSIRRRRLRGLDEN